MRKSKKEVSSKEVTNKTTKGEMLMVDPKNIIANDKDNYREDYGDIEGLAMSIANIGLQLPLKAKKVIGEDKWVLVDGYRRMKAINKLAEDGFIIPKVAVVPTKGGQESRIFSILATGINAKELTTTEQIKCVKQLKDVMGYSVEDISKNIGKSVPHIYHLLKLGTAPKQVLNLMDEGKISTNVVLSVLSKTEDYSERIEMINKAISDAEKEGKEKVTANFVDKTKRVRSANKITLLIDNLNNRKRKNEKMAWFLSVVDSVKNSSDIKEVLPLFK